jgi:hypothetical protein
LVGWYLKEGARASCKCKAADTSTQKKKRAKWEYISFAACMPRSQFHPTNGFYLRRVAAAAAGIIPVVCWLDYPKPDTALSFNACAPQSWTRATPGIHHDDD